MSNKSTTVNPFLLRYAKPCLSPAKINQPSDTFYDPETQMVKLKNVEGEPLLITSPSAAAPRTKKADVEKGEDQKDRRMWR